MFKTSIVGKQNNKFTHFTISRIISVVNTHFRKLTGFLFFFFGGVEFLIILFPPPSPPPLLPPSLVFFSASKPKSGAGGSVARGRGRVCAARILSAMKDRGEGVGGRKKKENTFSPSPSEKGQKGEEIKGRKKTYRA